MLELNDITVKDMEYFNRFLKCRPLKSSAYSFITMFMWRKYSNLKYTTINNSLILLNNEPDNDMFFGEPVGYEKDNLKEIIESMLAFREAHNMKYFIKDADAQFIKDLTSISNNFTIKEDRNCSDYIYESDKLAELSDKMLHKKRNHYNAFIKNYDYYVKDITEDIFEDSLIFLDKWFKENENLEDTTKCLSFEKSGITDLLLNFSLLDLHGIAVYVNNNIEGITIGEQVNENMAIIHVEKANRNIKGLYTFINKTFIEMKYKNVKYINREEDLGLEGLRKAKLSYKPYAIEMRYIIY